MSSSDYNQPPKTPELDVVRIVSFQDDKVLLVKEADDPNWKLPGGKTHSGETVFEAAVREVEEELGLQLSEGMISSYVPAPIPDSKNIRHIFLISPVGLESITSTTEVEEANYFSLHALPDTKFSKHILSAVRLVAA